MTRGRCERVVATPAPRPTTPAPPPNTRSSARKKCFDRLSVPRMPHTPPRTSATSAPVRRPRSDAVVVISSDDEDQKCVGGGCSNSEHSSPPDCIVLRSSCTRQRITDSSSVPAPLPSPLPCGGMYLTTVQVRSCSPLQHVVPSLLYHHNYERVHPPPDALHGLLTPLQGIHKVSPRLRHPLHYPLHLSPIALRGARCKL